MRSVCGGGGYREVVSEGCTCGFPWYIVRGLLLKPAPDLCPFQRRIDTYIFYPLSYGIHVLRELIPSAQGTISHVTAFRWL